MNVSLIPFSGNLNELVKHGLRALRETLPAEQDLTTKVRTRIPLPLLLESTVTKFLRCVAGTEAWKLNIGR